MHTTVCIKKKLPPQNIKNCPQKLLIIPLDQQFSIQQVLKFSHLWSCQTLQDEKIAYNFYDLGTIAFYYTVLNYLYSAKFCLVQNFEWNLLVLGNISLSVSLEVRKEA